MSRHFKLSDNGSQYSQCRDACVKDVYGEWFSVNFAENLCVLFYDCDYLVTTDNENEWTSSHECCV